jgi:hypothetical protein
MAESERKHGINDADAYWSLTTFGRNQLLRVRAIKRPEGHGQT